MSDPINDIVKRYTPLALLLGALLVLASYIFLPRSEAAETYARKDDIAIIRSDIKDIRDYIMTNKGK